MTCREVIEFLAEYLDNELPDGQRAVFERHLTLCPPCVDYLRTYRETLVLGKAAFVSEGDEPCGAIPEDLVSAILAARSKSA